MLVACALAGMLGLLPASALGAQACVQLGSGIGGTGAPQGGIGGTGTPAAGGTGGTGDWAGSGLGGTGAVAGGIGGTGDQADSGIGGTGIVGTITGFASVCIGELEVHFDAATSVSMNGQPGNLNQLALGQVVAMEAVRGAKGLTARTIAILNALEGPVTRAEAARGVLEVMGQPVRLTTGVDALRIAAGASVRVSGLRDVRGVVHATRVETAADLREASAIGFLRGSGGAVNLDGLSVVGVGGAAIRGELLVRGQWDGRQLLVRERCADPSLPFAGRVRDVVVEGLVHRRSALSLQISGFEVQLSSAARLGRDAASGIAEGSRVRIVGRIESGRRIIASRVEIERGRSGADDRTGGRGKGRRSDESTDDGRSSGSDNRGGDNRRSDDGSKRDSRSGERNEGSGDRGSRMEKVEKSDKVEKAEKPEIAEKVERVEKVEKLERSGKVDSAAERVEKAVRPESGRSGRN